MLKQIASLATAGIVALNSVPKAQAETRQTPDIIRMRLEDHYHTQLLGKTRFSRGTVQNLARMQFLGTSLRAAQRNSFSIQNLEEAEILPPRPSNEEPEAIPPRAAVLRRGRLSFQAIEESEEDGPSSFNFRNALREIEEEPGITSPLRMVVVDRAGIAHEVFDLESYFKQHMFNPGALHFRQSLTGHRHMEENSMEFGIGQEHGIKLNMNQFHASFNAHTLEQNTTNFGKFGFSFDGIKFGDLSISIPELSLGFMTDAKNDGLEKHTYITMDASLTAQYPIPMVVPGHRLRLAANISPLSFAYLGSHYLDQNIEEESLRISQTPASPAGSGAVDVPIQGGVFHDFTAGPLQVNSWGLIKTAPFLGPNPRFLTQMEAGSQLSMHVGEHIIGSISQSVAGSDVEASFNTALSFYAEDGDFNASANLMYIRPHEGAATTLGAPSIEHFWMVEGLFQKRIGSIVYGTHLLFNEEFAGLSLVMNMPFMEQHDLTSHEPSHHDTPEAPGPEKHKENEQKHAHDHVVLPFIPREVQSILNNKVSYMTRSTLEKVS